jgi:DNA-directed RNA polymerase specialized sigma24 family protein
MSKRRNEPGTQHADTSETLQILTKITRLLELFVRINLQLNRGDRTQRELVIVLDSIGCGPSEIVRLLGTSSNTVNVALSKAKKSKDQGMR